MPQAYWCPVLHAHLPYVRHPEHPRFLEEDWFFEALTETYVPLLLVLDGLEADGVDYRLTLSLSPPLLSMMTDSLLIERYQGHLDGLVDLAQREIERTSRREGAFTALARYYAALLDRIREAFRGRYGSRLVRAFRRLAQAGKLELLTCAATHGFLPLLDGVPQAVRAQVQVAAAHHRDCLGRDPRGIWLPECGYKPGQEVYLREAGLRFSFLEGHGLTHAHPRPRHGVRAPIMSPGGVVFFGRDWESSRQVWSAESGYPGDPDYREFYKDVGWELGMGRNVGIKYHRVTGRVDLAHKQPYDPQRARARAAQHAAHFLEARQEQARRDAPAMERPPLAVSPYDAELFGHWWFEGPAFLDELFRRLGAQKVVQPITPLEYLERHPECEVVQPPLSTWGARGYAEVWLDPANDWIYPHLDAAAARMVELARSHPAPAELERRALAQAARELLLAQCSDWAFMMKTGTTVEYAKRRTRDHLARFSYLYQALSGAGLEEAVLRAFEERDNIFPRLDWRVYR